MAGKFSVYTANQILNKVLRGTDWTPTGSYWVALFVGGLEAALRANTIGSAGEVANSNGYTRVEVRGATAITFSASSVGATENSSPIVFPTASGSWGLITHCALVDSATIGAGNIILYGGLSTAKSVDSGDTLRLNAGQFDILL